MIGGAAVDGAGVSVVLIISVVVSSSGIIVVKGAE